jgi:hypothetical protein
MIKMIAPGTLYRNMPFVCFLAFLGVIYIAFGHYAERNMRTIDALQDELREQRWHYMSVHSEVMKDGSRNRIAQSVDGSGLKTPRQAPRQLTIQSTIEHTDQ